MKKEFGSDTVLEAWQASEITPRKRAFQDKNHSQKRKGKVDEEVVGFISQEASRKAKFRFKE